MPVTLNIIADDATMLVQEFRRLNELTTDGPVTTLANTPLDALIDMVRERLRDDGFKLEIIDQRDPNPPPDGAPEAPPPDANAAPGTPVDKFPESPSPEPKTKRGRKANGSVPAEIITEPSTTTDEDITLPRPKKASKAAPMPLDDVSEPDPAGDRQHVLDTLASILKDPKQKDRVLGFASGMAKKHGKDKISELPVDPFPEIRQAMEKEFPNA